MTTNSKQDTFVLVPGVHIQVNSKSGNTYYITLSSDNKPVCTCKGFGYYQHCRHIEEAHHVHVEFFYTTDLHCSVVPDYSAIREHNLDIISGKAPAIKPQRRQA